jgi:hypothetical protein
MYDFSKSLRHGGRLTKFPSERLAQPLWAYNLYVVAQDKLEGQMKIEILYVRACPTRPTVVSLVRDILASQGITAQIVEVLVADEAAARELQFRGSPTIRVNDKDVVEESNVLEGGSLCCRVYSGSIRIGLPPVDAVRRAIVQAREGER